VKEAAVAHEKMAAAKIKRDALEGRVNSLALDKKKKEEEREGEEKEGNVKAAAAAVEENEENAQQQGHWAAAGRWMSDWGHSLETQLRKVRRLENNKKNSTTSDNNTKDRHAAAVLLLEAVLETFTDSTRFPCPRRPDAAVLVAAVADAYVSPQSVLDLHRHLPGSEIRWVSGGHVSSFLMHQPTFRTAIVDSLDKLNNPTNNNNNSSSSKSS
jgi:hypothetical protein